MAGVVRVPASSQLTISGVSGIGIAKAMGDRENRCAQWNRQLPTEPLALCLGGLRHSAFDGRVALLNSRHSGPQPAPVNRRSDRLRRQKLFGEVIPWCVLSVSRF